MEVFCKRNTELTKEEVEELFSLFLENMRVFAEQSTAYKSILTDSYKEKWIQDLLSNERMKTITFREKDELVSFIAIEELEEENFVQDFHIRKDYQKDGKTFQYMIQEGVKYLDLTKDFSGDIWILNNHSRDVFKHIGARYKDGKFRLSFEDLKNWLK